MSETTVQVSVTRLADLVCRQGDLDRGSVQGPSAQEGQRAHQRVQKQFGAEAESEVHLSHLCQIGSCSIRLTGRLDLLQTEARRVIEIKSTLVPADRLPESRIAHYWSQAMLYGWLVAETLSAEAPVDEEEAFHVELLLINLRDGQITRKSREYSKSDLTCHATEALSVYVQWLDQVERVQQALRESAVSLPFPYGDFRAGQRDMSAAIYRVARDQGTLMCEAPTGIGKTLSSLFAGVRALGEAHVDQLVYLTAKVSGQQGAMTTLQSLQQAGLSLFAMPVRARSECCFCMNGEVVLEEGQPCPLTVGFHDRLSEARVELLDAGVLDGGSFDAIARRHRLCPSALAQHMLPWAIVVVCDYNYVFDPMVRLSQWLEGERRILLLVDEAHNLVDRGREMYSATIDRLSCTDLAHVCKPTQPGLARRLETLASRLSELGRSCEDRAEPLREPPGKVLQAMAKVIESMQEGRQEAEEVISGVRLAEIPDEQVAQWLNKLLRFSVVGELFDNAHRVLVDSSRIGRRRQVVVRLRCLDAASALSQQYEHFHAVALFSATLYPSVFFRDALGLPTLTPHMRIASPFLPEQMLLCHAGWIDTRYRQRDQSLASLVDVVRRLALSREGNHLVFLPSYQYLMQLHEAFCRACPDIETWIQERGSQAESRRALLARLESPGLRVGFAIMGGVFGEGIDYVGDLLIGLVVVGTGLPPSSEERELIAEGYRQRGLEGYDFAYRFPGFTRVLQTTGRLIRTEQDRGVVLLVDQRFVQPDYRSLYPPHWALERFNDAQTLSDRVDAFWTAIP